MTVGIREYAKLIEEIDREIDKDIEWLYNELKDTEGVTRLGIQVVEGVTIISFDVYNNTFFLSSEESKYLDYMIDEESLSDIERLFEEELEYTRRCSVRSTGKDEEVSAKVYIWKKPLYVSCGDNLKNRYESREREGEDKGEEEEKEYSNSFEDLSTSKMFKMTQLGGFHIETSNGLKVNIVMSNGNLMRDDLTSSSIEISIFRSGKCCTKEFANADDYGVAIVDPDEFMEIMSKLCVGSTPIKNASFFNSLQNSNYKEATYEEVLSASRETRPKIEYDSEAINMTTDSISKELKEDSVWHIPVRFNTGDGEFKILSIENNIMLFPIADEGFIPLRELVTDKHIVDLYLKQTKISRLYMLVTNPDGVPCININGTLMYIYKWLNDVGDQPKENLR